MRKNERSGKGSIGYIENEKRRGKGSKKYKEGYVREKKNEAYDI